MKITVGSKVFEVSDEEIAKAQEAKTDITIPGEFVVRTTEEEESFSKNIKSAAAIAGLEVAIKEYRNETGLEFQGKNIEALVKAVQDKTLADAKIEPEEKLKKANTDIETLKTTIQTLQSEKQKVESEWGTYKKSITIDSKLSSLLPDNLLLPKEDSLLILKNRMKFDTDENGNVLVLGPNGEPLQDKTTLNPLPVKDVLNTFFTENPQYITGSTGGRGGNDSEGSKGKISTNDFIEQKKKDGVEINGEAFNKEYLELQEAGLIDDGE